MSSLCSLPEELRCYLLEFIFFDHDRRTVTKLNRACYRDMNRVIYTNMHVQQKFLTHDVTNKLHHFKHTTKLKIGGDFEGPHEQTDYEKFNFALMINACNPECVKKITFDLFLVPDAFRFVSERLHNIEYLKFADVEVAGLPWEKLSNFRMPKRLKVRECDITEANIKAICEAVPKLQGLDIQRCGDTLGEGSWFLQDIGGLQDLKLLCVGNNEFWGTERGDDYNMIAGLKKLEHLDLSSCAVDDTVVANIVRGSPNIEFLGIDRTDITDQGVGPISSLQYLRHLDLSDCKITDRSLQHVSKIITLRTLILYACEDITDNGLVHFPNLKHLINLDLNYCGNVTDTGVSYLSLMKTLRKLKLEECSHLTNKALSHIGKLSFIKKLNLSNNPNFTDDGLKHLVHLRFLHTIYFSFCEGISQEGVDKAGFADPDIDILL